MVTWIPSIYPIYVSIYTSTMDPMGIYIYTVGHDQQTDILWEADIVFYGICRSRWAVAPLSELSDTPKSHVAGYIYISI